VTPVFNTHRMVKEYTERLYLPAAKAHAEFARADGRAASELSKWKAKMRKDWPQVRISDVQIGNPDRQNIAVGDSVQVSAKVHLGAVEPNHVRVEAYYGETENGGIRNPAVTVLDQSNPTDGQGYYLYQGAVPASESGTYGFSVRVVPTHPHLMQTHELRLIAWS
jgi:starch phosphorylase